MKPLLSKEQWRAKREEARARQREQSVTRAAKMHRARLASEKEIRVSSNFAATPQVNVGCSGWFYWHWRGSVYPAELPTNQWFGHYADRLKTVELNAPFYSWPTVGTVHSWIKQAGRRRFTYTVKVSELITHVKKFEGTKALVRDFGYIADLLGSSMGCFLFQVPPSFHYTPARLHRILSQLDPARRNVVEFRHRSWWNDEVFAAFREAGAIFCSTSGPRLPEELVRTSDEVYIRFHGTKTWYRHDYSRAELTEWAEKIRASGARRVWAYFNNDRDGYAVKNAATFRRMLNALSPPRRASNV